jgi:catalase
LAGGGATGRSEYPKAGRADDFEQAGLLYEVMKQPERARVVANITGHLGAAGKEIQRRQVQHFTKANAEYGAGVAQSLGLDAADARRL